MTTQSFLTNDPGETYQDVPTGGGGNRGFIGHGKSVQVWQVAFLKDEAEVAGKT